MKSRRCTAFLDNGTKCGRRGDCTRVRQISHAPATVAPLHLLGLVQPFPWPVEQERVEWERWVCFSCRRRMRLPDEDVDFERGVTPISSHIDYTGTPLEKAPFSLP